ncbi:hypothetical protein [Silvanigrella sp.]|jgi:hypothetical protein|uniref:hypothetical protein n=1 Tax=Silvanigrella sp. TaxID=2024976 RepID=UPI0037CC1166
MNIIKRSFNLDPDTAQQIDEIIRENPSLSFTLLVNQALAQWVKDPVIELKTKRHTEEDLNKFLEENAELMDQLGHEKQNTKKVIGG